MKHLKNVSLLNYNTFRIDVNARELLLIENDSDLEYFWNLQSTSDQKILFLGEGSNILFEKEFDGLVVKNEQKRWSILEDNRDEVILEADSGLLWDEFVRICIDNNFYGLENLAAIPGSVGAAPVQNIGAYGIEQSSFFKSLLAFDISKKEFYEFPNDQCKFSYRHSIFKEKNFENLLIYKVRYKLSKVFIPNLHYKDLQQYFQDTKNITANELYHAVVEIRARKLPDYKEYPNAGSFFKNPIVSKSQLENILKVEPNIVYYNVDGINFKISAANLIEKTGLKGYRRGNVGISPKHSLIIVNFENATGQEVAEFASFVAEQVFDKFGVLLEREVIII